MDTTYPLLGQRLAFAPPLDPDDTTLATQRIRFDAEFDTVTKEKSTNFVLPVMRVAHAPVPAMSAFTGQTGAQGPDVCEGVSRARCRRRGECPRQSGRAVPAAVG